jgi:nucleoside 2-deoxyribosyltransferase
MMKIYLAGPDVFLPKPDEMGRRKKELCTQYGLTGLFPLDNAIDPKARDASIKIFRSNEGLMKEADAIIANLTPFRGPSADTGTVYELGYMAACGKLCLGYSNDPAPYVDRVKRFGTVEPCGGHLIDVGKLTVENFGLPDNLMMIHALDRYGCRLVVPKAAPADIWLDLTLFEECVKLAAARLPTSPAAS